MSATYTSRNRFTKQAIGSNTNTWGDVLNLVFDLIDASDDGVTTVTTTGTYTLTTANGAADEARRRVIRYTGATACTIAIPAVEKVYLVDAVTADCTITNGANSITVPGGMSAWIYTNGTLVRLIQNRWFANQRITGVATPTASTDAANKGYVDAQAFEAAAGNLPGQPGNAGKYLTTDGTNASWATTSFSFGSLTMDSGGTYTAGQITDAIGITDDIRRVGDIVWSASPPGAAYLLCDGTNDLRTAYPALSALMPDGRVPLTTITRRSLPTAPWQGTAWGNGVFVAIAPSSFQWASSTNGTSWTSSTSPNSGLNWSSVAYGNGVFVAVANGTATGASSANGTSWTSRTLPASRSWRRVAFGGGIFLAVSDNAGASNAATTADGINWTARTSGVTGTYSDLIYGNGVFVGLRSNAIDTTADGVTWATITPGFTLEKIAYANGVYVGFTSSGSPLTAYVSTDLVNWELLTVGGAGGPPRVLTVGNGMFVGLREGECIWSVDGRSWRRVAGPGLSGSDILTAATYGDGVFVAVADSDPDSSIAVSSNNILDATRYRRPDLRRPNTAGELAYIKAVA